MQIFRRICPVGKLVVSCGGSDFRDDTVKDESEVENKFAIPILGVIPDVNTAGGKRSDQYYYSYYASDEASPDKNKNTAGESEQKDDEKQK